MEKPDGAWPFSGDAYKAFAKKMYGPDYVETWPQALKRKFSGSGISPE